MCQLKRCDIEQPTVLSIDFVRVTNNIDFTIMIMIINLVAKIGNFANFARNFELPSSNCYEIDENVRFRIWRSAMAPSDAAVKNRHMSALVQSRMHNSPEDICENVLPL